jgi:hypothetical protein
MICLTVVDQPEPSHAVGKRDVPYYAALYRGFAHHVIQDSHAGGHKYSKWNGGGLLGWPGSRHFVLDLVPHWRSGLWRDRRVCF